MKRARFFANLLFTIFYFTSFSQTAEVYPPNWWVGMQTDKVQILIKSTDLDFSKSAFTIEYPGLKLFRKNTFENGKYVALDIFISAETKPGNVNIQLINGNKKQSINWTLNPRLKGNGISFAQGVTSADFIYLIMPDRFSNGDPANDRIAGMRDQTLNRDSIYYRHGGDLDGVINHLDYFQNLGVTALWMMPVLENDRTERSEHGYAFTNHYMIEPRFGGATVYKQLSDSLHKRGMKLIQDAVYNHVDIDHFLYRDMPSKDWFHQWPTYTGTSYKDQPLYDPYAAPSDKKITADGWFAKTMPDFDQTNPFVTKFLIQHAIWCTEEFGVDGWRIDTYGYNDPVFMNRCNSALKNEYPHISIFGEIWVNGTASQAYFVENNIQNPYKSNLPGCTDYQALSYGIIPALTQNFGWTEGVNKLYTTLSNDFLYKDASRNVIFLDNHDNSRFFSVVGENVEKQKIGIQWLLTCRGIPQMYYGTEILMKGFTFPDGLVRLDFPGGWNGDSKNAFTGAGLTSDELSVQMLVKDLAGFRKNATALKTGKMMQYVPQNGLYVYFRYDENQTIMCVMNTSKEALDIDFSYYPERTNGFIKAKSVTGKLVFNLTDKPKIEPMQMWVMELIKQ